MGAILLRGWCGPIKRRDAPPIDASTACARPATACRVDRRDRPTPLLPIVAVAPRGDAHSRLEAGTEVSGPRPAAPCSMALVMWATGVARPGAPTPRVSPTWLDGIPTGWYE